MPIGLAVFDALDSPVRASWRRRRDALDKNSAKSFEFRVAGSDSLGQRLLQGLARDRLARDLIVAFFPEDQFGSDASIRIPHVIQFMDGLPLRYCSVSQMSPLAQKKKQISVRLDDQTKRCSGTGQVPQFKISTDIIIIRTRQDRNLSLCWWCWSTWQGDGHVNSTTQILGHRVLRHSVLRHSTYLLFAVAMGARACNQHFDMARRRLADLDLGGLGFLPAIDRRHFIDHTRTIPNARSRPSKVRRCASTKIVLPSVCPSQPAPSEGSDSPTVR